MTAVPLRDALIRLAVAPVGARGGWLRVPEARVVDAAVGLSPER